jgi:hypothetical protein
MPSLDGIPAGFRRGLFRASGLVLVQTLWIGKLMVRMFPLAVSGNRNALCGGKTHFEINALK